MSQRAEPVHVQAGPQASVDPLPLGAIWLGLRCHDDRNRSFARVEVGQRASQQQISGDSRQQHQDGESGESEPECSGGDDGLRRSGSKASPREPQGDPQTPHPLRLLEHATSNRRIHGTPHGWAEHSARPYGSIVSIEPLPYFDAAALTALVPMATAIESLRQAFSEHPTHAARAHLRTVGAEFLVMPAAAGDVAGAKLVIVQPANDARGQPVIQGVYVLFDAAGGRPVALLDGAALTLVRTPAVSALATDVLARTDVHSIGILGTGPQALAHPAAIRTIRSSVSTVVVAGRAESRIAAIVAALRADGFDARSGTWAQAAACDIVCGCTRSSDPLITLSDVSPGAHLNLVGSYRTDLREVGADIVSHATVFVDDLDAAKAEAGELTRAFDEGRFRWDQVAGDLADIAAGNVGRQTTGEITLFKSVGLAVQDLVIAQLVARAAGLL